MSVIKAGTWTRISKAAALDARLSAEAFRVLAVLGCYADALGQCCPAVGTIAALRGVTRRQLQRQLRQLETFGYLTTSRQTRTNGRGGYGSNGYVLTFPDVTPDVASVVGDNATPDVTSLPPDATCDDASRCDTAGHSDATPHVATDATPRVALISPMEQAQGEQAQTLSARSAGLELLLDHPTENRKPPAPRKPGTAAHQEEADLESFWVEYPRKVDKGGARKAFKAACKKASAGTIILAARRFAEQEVSKRTEARFIAHPATWLNGERWLDEPEPAREIDTGNPFDLERGGSGGSGNMAAVEAVFGKGPFL